MEPEASEDRGRTTCSHQTSLRSSAINQRNSAARRAGNSVEVLLKRYAGCLDNQENAVNRQIDAALDDEDQAEDDD